MCEEQAARPRRLWLQLKPCLVSASGTDAGDPASYLDEQVH